MKRLLALTACLLIACMAMPQKKPVTTRPVAQPTQRIKIVSKTSTNDAQLVTQMNSLEIKMNELQAKLEDVQSELNDLSAQQTRLKNKLDSTTEMSQTTSLRLQMWMDRKTKFTSMLSNIMKKMNETQSAIVQNIK